MSSRKPRKGPKIHSIRPPHPQIQSLNPTWQAWGNRSAPPSPNLMDTQIDTNLYKDTDTELTRWTQLCPSPLQAPATPQYQEPSPNKPYSKFTARHYFSPSGSKEQDYLALPLTVTTCPRQAHAFPQQLHA